MARTDSYPDLDGPMLKRERSASVVRRVTLWGMGANLLLSGLKFAVGWLASSQALIADAVHSLSDTASDMAILVGVRYWSAPADADHPHGHGRIELLIGVVIGAMLAAAGIGLGYEAIATLDEPHAIPQGSAVIAVALVSMIAKEALYRWTARVGRKVGSSALAANAWHHRTDALSSVPVAIAGVGAIVWPTVTYLDRIAALVVTIFVLQAAWGITWPALQKLVDVGAGRRDCERILELTRSTPGVHSAHGLRSRYLGTGLQVDLHVLVDPNLTVRQGHDIAHQVQSRLLSEGPNVVNVLLHVEPYDGEGQ